MIKSSSLNISNFRTPFRNIFCAFKSYSTAQNQSPGVTAATSLSPLLRHVGGYHRAIGGNGGGGGGSRSSKSRSSWKLQVPRI